MFWGTEENRAIIEEFDILDVSVPTDAPPVPGILSVVETLNNNKYFQNLHWMFIFNVTKDGNPNPGSGIRRFFPNPNTQFQFRIPIFLSGVLNPGAVFRCFVKDAFLLFLAHAGGLTLWGQFSNQLTNC